MGRSHSHTKIGPAHQKRRDRRRPVDGLSKRRWRRPDVEHVASGMLVSDRWKTFSDAHQEVTQ